MNLCPIQYATDAYTSSLHDAPHGYEFCDRCGEQELASQMWVKSRTAPNLKDTWCEFLCQSCAPQCSCCKEMAHPEGEGCCAKHELECALEELNACMRQNPPDFDGWLRAGVQVELWKAFLSQEGR